MKASGSSETSILIKLHGATFQKILIEINLVHNRLNIEINSVDVYKLLKYTYIRVKEYKWGSVFMTYLNSVHFFLFFFFFFFFFLDHMASVKRFFSLHILIVRQSVELPGRGIKPSQGRYLTQTQNKHIQTSMP
jgi:hypothetical protein